MSEETLDEPRKQVSCVKYKIVVLRPVSTDGRFILTPPALSPLNRPFLFPAGSTPPDLGCGRFSGRPHSLTPWMASCQ
jgi:hypothetical protein